MILFIAPRTTGSTSAALNLALLHQYNRPYEKVGLLQLTAFPDLHLLTGAKGKHHIHQLFPFLKTHEWGPKLLTTITEQKGCDLLFSPDLKAWPSIRKPDFQQVFELINEHYDTLFVDLHHSVPEKIQHLLFEHADKVVMTTTVDPASLEATKILTKHIPHHHKQLLLNQCPPHRITSLKRWAKNLSLEVLGILPFEEKPFWHQTFEGLPVVFQRKSVWAKALLEVWEKTQSRAPHLASRREILH